MATYKKYTKPDFFSLIAPIVMQVHKEGGRLLPSVRLAQAWLETGGSVPSWNNLGGYKVGSGTPTAYWDGSSVNTATREVYNGVTVSTTANWRAYKSIYNYFKDQDLLFDKSRYSAVRAAKTPQEQCAALKTCGYATDPDYAGKLMSVITANNLIQYDAAPEPEGAKVVVNDKLVGYGRVEDGRVFLPLRQLGEALGMTVHWDNDNKIPYVDGRTVEMFSIIDGTVYVGVRAAAEMLGAQVSWSGGVKKVFIFQ
ncbi:glucosaminidase domain-containing protein [Cohnella thailandensis]|uniref:Glucosaminidase domain-containing protein n=1 Tax=Cohnella thailandensis TaxID=557557 RepID=A0A841SSZ7_9BACL|nr:glucosaminidase domain-containing protein [Cohnella thailandensis]MBB6632747.1 glucosaminidase domain-containing protein [Cohnella thailandensis]MBP1975564.1 flagellar protein FlgJ [Cohnella thailandensis]